jgi:hypothetical protein
MVTYFSRARSSRGYVLELMNRATVLNIRKTNIQATCDHRRKFTSYELGWPGAVTDVKVWKNSDVWKRRHLYFKNGEYILVDKGKSELSFQIGHQSYPNRLPFITIYCPTFRRARDC